MGLIERMAEIEAEIQANNQEIIQQKDDISSRTIAIINTRFKTVKSRARSANISIIMNTLVVALALDRLYREYDGGYSLWMVIQAVFATIMFGTTWYYGLYDKISKESLAKGIAGDLLLNLTMRLVGDARTTRTMHASGSPKGMEITVGFESSDQEMLDISKRITDHRTRAYQPTACVVKSAGLLRFTPLLEEYEFTPEDIKDLIGAMYKNPEFIEIFIILLNFIKTSTPQGGKNGKFKRRKAQAASQA